MLDNHVSSKLSNFDDEVLLETEGFQTEAFETEGFALEFVGCSLVGGCLREPSFVLAIVVGCCVLCLFWLVRLTISTLALLWFIVEVSSSCCHVLWGFHGLCKFQSCLTTVESPRSTGSE